jgi:hypothetical protein
MNLKKVAHHPKVCPECWKYIQSTACIAEVPEVIGGTIVELKSRFEARMA